MFTFDIHKLQMSHMGDYILQLKVSQTEWKLNNCKIH